MRFAILTILTLFPLLLFGQIEGDNPLDLSSEILEPKTYIIPKTSKSIVIDGTPERAWNAVDFTDRFIDIEGKKEVPVRTQVKMLWDDTFLYIYAELEEEHIWGNLKQRDTIIYLNNDFEVFIDPSPNTEVYAEIEINALNTVWDLLLNKPYRVGGFANFHWNLDALKTAVRIDGSLNDPSDTDKKWSVEMAIPLNALIELKNDRRKPIEEGDQWRMNFSRVQWDFDLIEGKYQRKHEGGKLLREHNWVWSNQGEINMHMPENWGIVQFTENEKSVGVTVKNNPDFLFQQALFACFREVRWGRKKHLTDLESGAKSSFDVLINADQTATIDFRKTRAGFELTATNSHTGNRFVIDQEGRLKQVKQTDDSFKITAWSHGSQTMDTSIWSPKLRLYDSLGISELLVGGSPEFLQDLVYLAREHSIKIHAWMWTLNRPNDSVAQQHPEWYAVNRNGDNSLDYRAYVDYYQWLSPFHPEAREYVKRNVRKLLEVEGLASIHLDYVRYVDVILGADLQPKYGLVQDHEMPEYDYDYHLFARSEFKRIFGKDPMEMEHPELSTEWRQFRLNAITTLVNEIADEVHNEGQHLSAAVFPFPEMSRQMVRQAWDDWNLDFVFPMIYHNFYRENINWIGFATQQGVNDVDSPLYSGLYIPGFENAEDFKQAIQLAQENGAVGVSLFTADNLPGDFKQVLYDMKVEAEILKKVKIAD